MVFEESEFSEDQSDTRLRAVWLKANKARLARVCLCIVTIESDAMTREEQLAQSAGLVKAFGIPRRFVADAVEAGKGAVNRGEYIEQSSSLRALSNYPR
ncbi:hypothetical protein BTHE68_72240 (plasmid) [Burkholderia sp. THE68]|uniref:hypothetical protein n=1 Tax=Burkholderia sp. THE68 TaxID=758782 RepID=UPI00131911F1|nr:hypothetical protein [Burkholderia sp. THE68]BBU33490.1 hypothetical protein BTHE68_72240 [Burkholderia sp. THE68]